MHLIIKLKFFSNVILKIIKPLYRVPEAGNYWFNIYHFYHCKKIEMILSAYDLELLYIKNNRIKFEIVGF